MINDLQEAYLQIYQNDEDSSEQEDLSEAKVKYATITRNGQRVQVPVMTDALRAKKERERKREEKIHDKGSNVAAGLGQEGRGRSYSQAQREKEKEKENEGEKETKPTSTKVTKLRSDAKKKSAPPSLDDLLNSIRKEEYFQSVITSHLLDEGYVDTVESAEAVMYSMSESWLLDILEKLSPEELKIAKSGILSKRADELEAAIKSATTKKKSTTPEVKKRKVTRQTYVVR